LSHPSNGTFNLCTGPFPWIYICTSTSSAISQRMLSSSSRVSNLLNKSSCSSCGVSNHVRTACSNPTKNMNEYIMHQNTQTIKHAPKWPVAEISNRSPT
jgi:hypothetical protein